MTNTPVVSSEELCKNYEKVVYMLKEHTHVIIATNGVPEVVLIGYKDFAKFEEFLHHCLIHEDIQKSEEYINTERDKSMLEATDPNTQMLSHDEMIARMSERHKARNHTPPKASPNTEGE